MHQCNIYEAQRDFAESSGLKSQIIWDSLSSQQSHILKQKIATVLSAVNGRNTNELNEQRELLFQNIWEQRKYTNGVLLSSIIYIMVTNETTSHDLAKLSKKFSCHPVFRTRKCMNNNNSTGCCMIFIDEHARVYQNWQQYVLYNYLPQGTMIAPVNGIYTFKDNGEVQLECHPTPQSCTSSYIVTTTDRVMGIGGVIAGLPLAAAFLLPVAAPMMIAATAAVGVTAAYTAARSAYSLTDRYWHCQPTGLGDREARSSWLGIASSVLGLSGTVATTALTVTSSAGLATEIAVNSINVSSIVVSGTGFVNSVYDIYLSLYDDNGLNSLDVLQLASSLLIFTHSINNYQLATKVIASNRSSSSLRQMLQTEIRNIYCKIKSEAAQLTGVGGGKFDIIRIVNEIPIQSVLMSLHKLNGHLRSKGVAFTAIGFSVSAMFPVSNFILGCVGDATGYDVTAILSQLSVDYGIKFVEHIFDPKTFGEVVMTMLNYLSHEVCRLLIGLGKEFIERNVDSIDLKLHTFINTETVQYRILMYCVNEYSDFSFEYLRNKKMEILNDVKTYYDSLNPNSKDDGSNRFVCDHCKGHYYVCEL